MFKMNKKGFISTALIYTFFIIFMILMVFLISNYSSTKFLTDKYHYDIQEELYELSNMDINLNVYVWNNTSKEYDYVDEIPTNRNYNSQASYCKNGSKIELTNEIENGVSVPKISISATAKDYCYIYFE